MKTKNHTIYSESTKKNINWQTERKLLEITAKKLFKQYFKSSTRNSIWQAKTTILDITANSY